jgi:anti-sigma regulatory factor (Ser/Thr protein kinase)
MAVVEVSFSALPTYVRTARLIAVEVARHAGLDDHLVDEVRFAVGEACAQAVRAHRRHAPHARVGLALAEREKTFEVQVRDFVLPEWTQDQAAAREGDAPAYPELGETFLTALVDDIRICRGERGGEVTMCWPIPDVIATRNEYSSSDDPLS